MTDFKSIGQITAYKPLARCDMEELAARQHNILPSGGVLFARNADGDEKTAARQAVLDLFHPVCWPQNLRMLTMPSVQWRFERKLLAVREPGWMRSPGPRRTFFTGVENDRAIFFAAAGQIPGLSTPKATLRQSLSAPYAERGIFTNYAKLYFANVDDLMAQYNGTKGWHAAWLDYTGPLTPRRLKLISDFYHRCVHSILIVTSLKARFDRETSDAVARAGSYSQWLRNHLAGEVLHDFEYFDTSPISQFAVRRTHWRSPLV